MRLEASSFRIFTIKVVTFLRHCV